MLTCFSKKQLNQMFLSDLGNRVEWHSDVSTKPLLIDLVNPKKKLRVYLFNCTCPPGGRALDEYKIQLRVDGQKPGERANFDTSDDRFVLVVGFASPFVDKEDGVYVMWTPAVHQNFAYSANLQCYLDSMLETLLKDVVVSFKRRNRERVVMALRRNLSKAVEHRIDIDIQFALEQYALE